MSVKTKTKREVSADYKKRLKGLLFKAFGRIPEETSYSCAGRYLKLSHSSIKAWVDGSLKWEIHPTNVAHLAEILKISNEILEAHLRYGHSLETESSPGLNFQPTLAEVNELLRRRFYRATPEDSLYLLEIVATANNLLLQAEISRREEQQNSKTQTVVPFVDIEALTKYLQSQLAPEDYASFLAECPLTNDHVADLVEIIVRGKTESLPLETVKDVLPALASGLSSYFNKERMDEILPRLKGLI